MPIIAKEIAINNKINAYSIAKAENKISATSKDESEIKKKNQLLKYLWHTLVKYGEPIEWNKGDWDLLRLLSLTAG